MSELRLYSTRARNTPTSFFNDYWWGDFKRDEDAWMEKYFDAFLYIANWGTRVLKFLVDLRDLDARGKGGDSRLRIEALRQAHAHKTSLIGKLHKAGL